MFSLVACLRKTGRWVAMAILGSMPACQGAVAGRSEAEAMGDEAELRFLRFVEELASNLPNRTAALGTFVREGPSGEYLGSGTEQLRISVEGRTYWFDDALTEEDSVNAPFKIA